MRAEAGDDEFNSNLVHEARRDLFRSLVPLGISFVLKIVLITLEAVRAPPQSVAEANWNLLISVLGYPVGIVVFVSSFASGRAMMRYRKVRSEELRAQVERSATSNTKSPIRTPLRKLPVGGDSSKSSTRWNLLARKVEFPVEVESRGPERMRIRFLRQEAVPAPLVGVLLSFRRTLSALLGAGLAILTSSMLEQSSLRKNELIWIFGYALASMPIVYFFMPKGELREDWEMDGYQRGEHFMSFLIESILLAFPVAFLVQLLLNSIGRQCPWWQTLGCSLTLTFLCHGAARLVFTKFRDHASRRYHTKASRRDFAIGFFRSFDASYSRFAFYELSPLLAAYGRLVYLIDVIFSIESQVHGRSIDLDFNSESTGQSWRSDFLTRLLTVDLAVFDLSQLSSNIQWELEQALGYLNPNRIILVAHRDADVGDSAEKLRMLWPPGQDVPEILRYDSGVFGTWAFRMALYRRMRELSAPGALTAGGGDPSIHLPLSNFSLLLAREGADPEGSQSPVQVDASSLVEGLVLTLTPPGTTGRPRAPRSRLNR